MSCSATEPRFVCYELTKTWCGVYETVRSSCQHSLEFGWMEKRELILVAQSSCDYGSQLGTFRQRQSIAVLNTNRSRECTREKAKERDEIPWWAVKAHDDATLCFSKFSCDCLNCLLWFFGGFFFLANSTHKKLLTHNCLKRPFLLLVSKTIEKNYDDKKNHFRFV